MGLTNPISRSSPQTVWNFSLERRRYLGLGRRISEKTSTCGRDARPCACFTVCPSYRVLSPDGAPELFHPIRSAQDERTGYSCALFCRIPPNRAPRFLRGLGSTPRRVGELLARDRCGIHQATFGHGKYRHAVVITAPRAGVGR